MARPVQLIELRREGDYLGRTKTKGFFRRRTYELVRLHQGHVVWLLTQT